MGWELSEAKFKKDHLSVKYTHYVTEYVGFYKLTGSIGLLNHMRLNHWNCTSTFVKKEKQLTKVRKSLFNECRKN